MAALERIQENTANGVRAGAAVATMGQAVHELLSNSIDAGATSVEIKLDLPCYRFSVADNGHGIPAEKLRNLVGSYRASHTSAKQITLTMITASWPATSKASCRDDMQHAKTYGFRGEALYSQGLSSLLEIQSRCAGQEAYAKVIREGHLLHFGRTSAPSRSGTIVTVRDAFFKWPVRRKATSEAAVMARIKDMVSRMALLHSSVAIKVLDSAHSKQVLKVVATGSVTRTFAQVFSSDKLSMARKLTFAFKQFRITGYLSPPSSSACHWSKELQLVYVNRRSVRRLDFVQKTINKAFAPCLAFLCGRGGAVSQGAPRRARDPNASSGQRQELFPVFLLNVECPPGDVDVMVEPDKTLVEFSDWPSARNALVALLLAFLVRFPHAVPGTVLRDLRRTYHRTEGEQPWRTASPSASIVQTSRVAPEAIPAPSPSPLRLGMPDVGAPSSLHECPWMADNPEETEGTSDRRVETMAFHGDGICAQGYLFPSPASRLGLRDENCSTFQSDVARTLGRDIFMEASPHFTQRLENEGNLRDGTGDLREEGAEQESFSPFFERGRSSQDNGDLTRPVGSSLDTSGDTFSCEPGWRCDDLAVPTSAGTLGEQASGGRHLVRESAATSHEVAGLCDQALCEKDSTGSEPGPGCPRGERSLDSTEGEATVGTTWIGRRDEVIRAEPGAVRETPSADWLRRSPGHQDAENALSGFDKDVLGSALEGGTGGDLSRFFEYVFDNEGTQWSEQEARTPFPLSLGSGGTQIPPTRAATDKSDLAAEGKAAIGVLVRRPPSPKFSFMGEAGSSDRLQDAPPMQSAPPSGERPQAEETVVAGHVGPSTTGLDWLGHQGAEYTTVDDFTSDGPPSERAFVPNATGQPLQGVTLSPVVYRTLAPSHASKRKRPSSWASPRSESTAPPPLSWGSLRPYREVERVPCPSRELGLGRDRSRRLRRGRHRGGGRRKSALVDAADDSEAAEVSTARQGDVLQHARDDDALRSTSGEWASDEHLAEGPKERACPVAERRREHDGGTTQDCDERVGPALRADDELSHCTDHSRPAHNKAGASRIDEGRQRGATVGSTRDADVALAYDRDDLGCDGPAGSWLEPTTRESDGDGLSTLEACDSCHSWKAGGDMLGSSQGSGGHETLQVGTEAIRGDACIASVSEPVSQVPQAGRKFILLRARTGAILCVDQHAADERIKLEYLERQVFGEIQDRCNVKKLVLDPPEALPLTDSDKDLLETHRRVLASWHFEFVVQERLDHKGSTPTAMLLAVPAVFGVRLSVQDLLGFLHHLRETVEAGSSALWLRPPQVQHILNYKACHSAIRFGDFLSRAACVQLIRKLASCARPFYCAHGRPSVVPLCVFGKGRSSVDRGRRSRRIGEARRGRERQSIT